MANYQLNSILSYLYNGKKVVLLYTEEMKNSGFEPFVTEGYERDPYELTQELVDYINENDISVCATYDDCYSMPEPGVEITYTQVKNIENEQHLIYEWVTKSYAEWDEFEREYLDKTDRYYHWTSQRTYFIERIERIKEVWGRDHDWKAKELDELRQEWDKDVEEARPENNPYDIFCIDSSFDKLIEQAE